MSNDKVLIGAKEAAQLMNVSMPTFYQLVNKEGFPAIRVGRKILVSVVGLQRWVEANHGRTFEA